MIGRRTTREVLGPLGIGLVPGQTGWFLEQRCVPPIASKSLSQRSNIGFRVGLQQDTANPELELFRHPRQQAWAEPAAAAQLENVTGKPNMDCFQPPPPAR